VFVARFVARFGPRVAALALPQRIDDQQNHADHGRADTDPGDHLIAGDDCCHQRGKADDGHDKCDDKHWRAPG